MPPTAIRLDGFLDIECYNWDRFVCGAMYRPIDGTKMVRTADDLVDHLLKVGGWWWAWNGGKYDTLQIAEILRRRGLSASCRMSGSAVSRIVCGHLTILDACALVPMALDDAAPLAGLVAPQLGWDCICGDSCGGYCRIRRRMDLADMATLLGYCAEDARIGYETLAAVLTRFAQVGMVTRGTLGGTAWETARVWASLPVAKWRSEIWRFVHRAYYGGRVIVARPHADGGTHHDLASAYPAALAATALPLGEPVEAGGRRARLAYERGVPGVYKCVVDVGERWIPPLPVRNEDESISYPIGEVRGTWTLPELYAAEMRGARILRMDECVAWPDAAERVMSGPVQRWYGLRTEARAAGDAAWEEMWRLVPNSITGKFAEQPERQSVSIHPRQIKYCTPASERSARVGCTRQRCTGRCGSYQQLDRNGVIWAIPFYRIGESAHVHWAAYLTSATRIDVMNSLDLVGKDLVYTDTDSIWSIGTRPYPLGDELGQWRFKHRFADWSCLAPKVYRYTDPATGQVICRVAGAPDVTDARWGAGRQLDSARGVMSLREGARTDKLFQRRRRIGRLPEPLGWYGDRRLQPEEGITYPVRHGEAKERTYPPAIG